jgi:hypothetical protein
MNCPHWLLALTIPFSRSDRAHTDPADVGAGCPEGLVRTAQNRRRVSFGCRRAREAGSDGSVTLPDASQTVNAQGQNEFGQNRPARKLWLPWYRAPGRTTRTPVPPPMTTAGSRPFASHLNAGAPFGGMRGATLPSACHLVSGPNGLSALGPGAKPGLPGRALPAGLLDLPPVHCCRTA